MIRRPERKECPHTTADEEHTCSLPKVFICILYVSYQITAPAHLELVELHMMHCKAPTLSAVVATKYVVVQCTAQCTAHMSLFIFVSVIVDEYASDGV